MQTPRQIKTDDFAADVVEGLSGNPKSLSSKYFYDDEGSRLFREIMKLPEYYLTRAELEIFQTQAAQIFEEFSGADATFDLIELGAGDGSKTAILIEHFLERKVNFTYVPVDISAEAQKSLADNFSLKFPALSIRAETGDYFEKLETLNSVSGRPKIVLFLGSNIGNFSRAESIAFFKKLRAAMNSSDSLFIGFDLQKDPNVILRAYDDSQGVTAAFNLNLLQRINRELEADFDLKDFFHYAVYHPVECAARSFIISRNEQTVCVKRTGKEFHFRRWEPIFMEISQKYSLEMIEELAAASGFTIACNFFDSQKFFVNSLWKPVMTQ